MSKLREHPGKVTLAAFGVAAIAVVAIAAAFGFRAFADGWSSLDPGWLALAIGAELLAFPAYVVAYRAVARIHGGPELSLPLAARVVTTGFGPFAVGGGFALDKRALHAIENDEHAATVRVLGLGALEWAVLAPVAWISALALLAAGDGKPMPSLLWPWVIAVPVGFAIGLWLAGPGRRERFDPADGGIRGAFGTALRGVGILRSLAASFPSCWAAWVGAALYWAFDIAALYGALRFVGLHTNLAETILAYATGYALTRRSTPLGGAGATEALMTFALHWVGQPVAPALAAVVVYRVVNFVLPTLPALATRSRVMPLIEAADAGRVPAHSARRHAAVPLRLTALARRATAPWS